MRQCADPKCVLWHFDATGNGSRRRHSMATCGDRAKAERCQRRRSWRPLTPPSRGSRRGPRRCGSPRGSPRSLP
ncbi:CGNR zinc finger domain-containing protein [Glycomyces sp. TRM65418]|uniref:CGNR zinc finger domain-containing protein n=1 Tax=Glycomyces sp. TRM65418 TaxID=2867006 RepID=UPI0035ABDBA3|nr:CGNR zinc finger domain-containing protein [Glycomyces sp. TRM65418]